MLHIFYGAMPDAIFATSVYFDNTYSDQWITDDLTREIIQDIDRSTVIGPHVIESPVLGGIPPEKISHGAKTLILISHDQTGKIFNASTCGDDCAKWLLKFGRERDITINLRHMMNFGKRKFQIHILNNDAIAHNMDELIDLAGEYIWRVQ